MRVAAAIGWKLPIPNPTPQVNPKLPRSARQAPNSKNQAPEKFQIPNPKIWISRWTDIFVGVAL
ncbi:MAG: hypothetical protein DME97_08055 [Verrucomicrobia bacterium]|nr:MAG: hypothetical protein DME97_08055 [Verrucomicrobiota bacterium]